MLFLKDIRIEHNLNYSQMAKRLGISKQRYYHLERKGKGCNAGLLCRLVDEFGLCWCKLGELLRSIK